MSKTLPHDTEAEKAILGAIFLRPEILPKVRQTLSADDFYFAKHKLIYQAMLGLEEIDAVTVADKLRGAGVYQKTGGNEYLAEIIERIATSMGFQGKADIIRELSIRRQIIQRCQETAEKAYTGESEEILSVHKNAIRQIESTRQEDWEDTLELLRRRLDLYNERSKGTAPLGIPTGFDLIDSKWIGLEPACVYYLKAKSQSGKSMLALQIADNVAREEPDKKVIFYTLESSKGLLTDRRISRVSNIPLTRLRTGTIHGEYEWQRLVEAMNEVPPNVVLIDDYRMQKFPRLEAHIESIALEHSLSCVIIDFLQLLSSGEHHQNRHLEMSAITVALNALSKKLQVPLLILSQVNPQLQAKESGDIENNAAYVMLLEREPDDKIGTLRATKAKDNPLFSGSLQVEKNVMLWRDVYE